MLAELMDQARAGRAGFYLLFGGQGAGWFNELRAYYADARLRPLLDLCLEAIAEEMPTITPSIALPHGFDVATWLKDPSTIPSPDYLTFAGVSVPLIFMSQLASVHSLADHGVEIAELLRHTRGISGQSQGLFAACLLGLSRRGADYSETVRKFVKFVFYLGVRSQEIYPFAEPTQGEVDRSAAVSTWRNTRPTPMVAVVDAQPGALEGRIRRFNSKLKADKHVQLGLTFSTTRVVLSAHRASLIDFNAQQRDYIRENAIKYVYVRTTCPFHSRLMEPIRAVVEADFARIGFGYAGNELQVPVYSSNDGRNLQEDEEVAIGLYLDALIRPLDWRRALRPVQQDTSVSHVIDFGPGRESRNVSRHVLESLGCRTPILSASELTRAA